MLEQEIASIIKFTLDNSGNPAPYYYDVPQSFTVPAAYFPTPEVATGGDTFSSYTMEYSWYIKYFHITTEKAYALALQAITALKQKRNLVPLINEKGDKTGKGMRLDDPAIIKLDDGAIQLTINWISRRRYETVAASKMQEFEIENWNKPDLYASKTISEAMESAIENYLKDSTK